MQKNGTNRNYLFNKGRFVDDALRFLEFTVFTRFNAPGVYFKLGIVEPAFI